MNADERRFAVLRAIVADYVATHEPVGSKMIVERHNLGVSSATVRNDMAVLEDEGLIAQPHTSAGRVPTDKGYRLFVDRLAQVKPLSVAELRTVLNAALRERRLADAPDIVSTLPDSAGPELRPVLTTLTSVLLETLVERPEERVVLGGTANLTRSALDFPGTIRPVLEALEEQVVLLRLIGEVQSPSRVLVRIGEENPYEGLRSTSVVSVGYGPGDRALGGLGVLGPTRMDYAGTMTSVAAVARYIGQILGPTR